MSQPGGEHEDPDAEPDLAEVVHDLHGLLAAAALRLEVVRRRHGPEVGFDADLDVVERAVAEARQLLSTLPVDPGPPR